MNPHKSCETGCSRFIIALICGSLLAAFQANAQISVVNTGFLNDTANQTSYTLSFDAGSGGTANKLIVSAVSESVPAISGITYNGAPLTLIPNTGDPAAGRNRGIWYLDNPFSGGATGTSTYSSARLPETGAPVAAAPPGVSVNPSLNSESPRSKQQILSLQSEI